jgi:hypothetical protein
LVLFFKKEPLASFLKDPPRLVAAKSTHPTAGLADGKPLCKTIPAWSWHDALQQDTRRHGLTLRTCVGVFYVACLYALVPALAEVPSDDTATGVRQAVLGIMSYTKWPGSPTKVRLCVVGQPGFAEALLDSPMQFGATQVEVDRRAVEGGGLGDRCDAVYAGAMEAPERDALHRQLVGHAVLTMTEDDPHCSGQTMFCLDIAQTGARAGSPVGFSVNLDSVARSGVAVSPRVLLLGRRRKPSP